MATAIQDAGAQIGAACECGYGLTLNFTAKKFFQNAAMAVRFVFIALTHEGHCTLSGETLEQA